MLRRILRDTKGVTAVEFAMVAPLLVSILLCLCDLAPTITARTKSANATASVADLTAQFANVRTSDVADIYAGAQDVLAPLATSSLQMRLTEVASDGAGNAFVYWSCGQGTLPPLTAKSPVTTTPSGGSLTTLLQLSNSGTPNANSKDTAVIEVEAKYTYTAPAQFLLKTPLVMTAASYATPRVSAYVGFPWDGNANDQPTAPSQTTKTNSTTLSNGAVCNYAY